MFSRIILVLTFILLTANFLLSLRIGISSHSDRGLVKRQAEVISGLRSEVADLRTKVEQVLTGARMESMAAVVEPPPLASALDDPASYPPPPTYPPAAPGGEPTIPATDVPGSVAGSADYPPVPASSGTAAVPGPASSLPAEGAPAAAGLASPRVTYVQPQYGFIVFNVGQNDGLRVGQSVLIKRQGNLIARVKISTVEPSQAIGDLIPGSLTPGLEVQVGDAAELLPR